MKVVFLEPVSSLDGSYAAKESHDLPEILARQWTALGYCRIAEEVATAAAVQEVAPESVTTAPNARQQRFKPLRNRTPEATTSNG
jgi:hypothetical protein